MFYVSMTDDVQKILKNIVENEGNGYGLRIFQYQTGTPCCRKTLLGVTPDKKDFFGNDAEQVHCGIYFYIDQDVIDQYGEKYSIKMNEHNMPDVTAE